MLCNLPTEIIELILLNLSLRDLLETIRINRRLCAIAHNPKSRLKHRLVKRRFELRIEVNRFHRGITMRMRNSEINSMCNLWFNNIQNYNDWFESVGESVLEEPMPFINKYVSGDKRDDNFMVNESTEDATLSHLLNLLSHLIHFCAIGEFNLDIESDAGPWFRIAPFFESNHKKLFCRPSVRIAKCELDTDAFFSNGIFAKGLEEIKIHIVTARNPPRDSPLLDNLLKTAKYVSIYCLDEMTKLNFNDGEIFTIFGRTNYLELTETRHFTKDGISELFRNFYIFEQMPDRFIKIDSFECFNLKEMLAPLPRNSYEYKRKRDTFHGNLFNREEFVLHSECGQQWRISGVMEFREVGDRLTITIANNVHETHLNSKFL